LQPEITLKVEDVFIAPNVDDRQKRNTHILFYNEKLHQPAQNLKKPKSKIK